jgi:NAD(P)-dependent dehydrogenase (short-subunit alcohol dehydrogenase family)
MHGIEFLETTNMDAHSAQRRPSILITGAASGIGRATAQLFARQGWFIGGLDVNAPALDSLRTELGANSGLFRAVDVTDRTALLAVIDEFARATGGKLDLLFNNAGIEAKGRFEAMPWDKIVAIVDVNLLAGMSLIHATLPLLKATDGALCLSTSSASAIFGTAGLAVYSATKHAIKGLTEALAVEFKAYGVRVADVLPGIVDTGMLSERERARLPKEGMLRTLPAQAIADTVWAAYAGDRLHWYVPIELSDYDIEVTRRPEAARDRRIAGGF